MWRIFFGMFLIVHGLIHAAIWGMPVASDAPFDPHRSWLLGTFGIGASTMNVLSIVLSVIATIGFVGGGIAFLAHHEWWPALIGTAALAGLVLVTLYFHVWLSVAVVIQAAILVAVVWSEWSSEALASS